VSNFIFDTVITLIHFHSLKLCTKLRYMLKIVCFLNSHITNIAEVTEFLLQKARNII